MSLTDKISATPREVRKFGLLFAAICAGLTGYFLYKGNPHWPWPAGGAVFFLTTGLFARKILRPLYIGWMTLAFVLGWVNTRLILGIFFYLVLTPIALLMRIFGKDPLERRFNYTAATYWKRLTPAPPERAKYERLF